MPRIGPTPRSSPSPPTRTCCSGDATPAVAALMRLIEESRAELIDLHVRKATLEDVFLALTKEETK